MSLLSSTSPIVLQGTYIAIDFETADYTKDSACAIGLARIENGCIVHSLYSLLRPPKSRIRFTEIHGITWQDVKSAPTFNDFLPEILEFFAGATGFVAHNAPFDKGVLAACLAKSGHAMPEIPFFCTCKGSRAKLGLKRNKLSDVCNYLHIDLQHHHAGSDALAAAHVFLHLCKNGLEPKAMQIINKNIAKTR